LGGIFENREFGDVFANSAITNSAMVKWRLRLDSAHQGGLETTIHGVLIVVVSGSTGG